jgi:hypothetical protein
MSVEKRQAYWREAIEYCEPQVQVAVDGEKIVGFVGYDRSRDENPAPPPVKSGPSTPLPRTGTRA